MFINRVQTQFQALYGRPCACFHAPGRINIIGEHTDYNQGLVLPAAIDKGISFAIALNDEQMIRLHALDLDESYVQPSTSIAVSAVGWANYLLGVVAVLQKKGHTIPGFDCVFGGNIPVGAGLSSSAALESGLATALNDMLQLGLRKMELALVAQKAEHSYAGVQCGLMDQFASIFGRAGQVVELDCRSLQYRYFPLPTDQHRIVLVNSMVKHALADSAYNTRREECAAGVAYLAQHYPVVQSLRDVSLDMLAQHKDAMDPIVWQRCDFVVRENARVIQAGLALQAGKLDQVGALLYASHAGLQHDYAVSCPELDFLVAESRTIPEILGARMMGGGFGGCTINLVEAAAVAQVSERLQGRFAAEYGIIPEVYITQISDGAGPASPVSG